MNNRRILKNGFYFMILFCFFGAIFWTSFIVYSNLENFIIKKINPDQNNLLLSLADSLSLSNEILEKKINVLPPKTQAKSAIAVIVAENKSQILFEKYRNNVLPIASITKLMTALIVEESYNLNGKIIITKEAEKKAGSLIAGDEFYVKDLLKIMLVESDNTAAFALSGVAGQEKFVSLMNTRAKELGMKNTSFDNSIGVGANCTSTAQDLVVLAEYILNNNPEIFEFSKTQSFDLFSTSLVLKHKAKNINKLLFDTSLEFKDKIIGGKTGSNPYAEGCLLLITKSFNNKGHIITVVINAGQNTDNRFVETKNIINWIESAYKWN